MKMSYRVATAAVAAALSLSVLAGCGAQSSSSAAASSSAAPAATETSSSSSAASSSSTTASSSSASSSSAAADATNTSSSSEALTQNVTNNTEISPEEAKAVALSDAGLAEADVTNLKVELDRNDVVPHYDVEFKAGGQEYDYDIALANGSILQAKAEVDD